MAGIFTLSGTLIGLNEASKARLRRWIRFWKERREFITSSSCRLLTPPALRDELNGWAAFQLQAPREGRRLLLAYRLEKAPSTFTLKPEALDPRRRYQLRDGEGRSMGSRSGAELMRKGLALRLSRPFSAKVVELLP
jgi:hypothetical protein